jgi:hypothetical protein
MTGALKTPFGAVSGSLCTGSLCEFRRWSSVSTSGPRFAHVTDLHGGGTATEVVHAVEAKVVLADRGISGQLQLLKTSPVDA